MKNMDSYYSFHAPCARTSEEAVLALRSLCLERLDSQDITLLRFFCSDVYHHSRLIERLWPSGREYQRVYIGQTPLDSAFISLQAYCQHGTRKEIDSDGSLRVERDGELSFWFMDYPVHRASAALQTDEIIGALQNRLGRRGLDLERNVVRTWYYIRDIDNNYDGMIESRVRHYEAAGLRADTHFIASTGIGGQAPDPHALVCLHTYAIADLMPCQIRFLHALDHLSPTHIYGVNFERASLIRRKSSRECHISGTASIDAGGKVLYKNDVIKQFGRTVENMEALLSEGGMGIADLAAVTIYLRDSCDAARILPMARDVFPGQCAINITSAPVCRPDWLIEIEGEALAPVDSKA